MNSIFNILQNLNIDSNNYYQNHFEDHSKLGHYKYFISNFNTFVNYEEIDNKPIELVNAILLDDVKMVDAFISNGQLNFFTHTYIHTFSRYVAKGFTLLKAYSIYTGCILDILKELQRVATMLKYTIDIEYIMNDVFLKINTQTKKFILFTSEIGLKGVEIQNKNSNPLNQLYSLEVYNMETIYIEDKLNLGNTQLKEKDELLTMLDLISLKSSNFISTRYTPYSLLNFQFKVLNFSEMYYNTFLNREQLVGLLDGDDATYGILLQKVNKLEIINLLKKGLIPSNFRFLNIKACLKGKKSKLNKKFILQIGELKSEAFTIKIDVEVPQQFYKDFNPLYSSFPERIVLPKIHQINSPHVRLTDSKIYYIESLNTIFISNKIIWDYSKELPLKNIKNLDINSTTIEIFKSYLTTYYNLFFKIKILYTLKFENITINIVRFKSEIISFTTITTIYPMLINLDDVIDEIVDIDGCDEEFVKINKVLA